jgi:23S rRNA pseudouridine2605 synthase
LNGETVRNPEAPVRLEKDRIALDGNLVSAENKVYLMLNKPRGIVTTASDEKDRKTVYDFVDVGLPFVAPVGRLDKASEGLLLLTNDSEWSARVLSPETHLEKTYHVQIGCVADDSVIRALERGVRSGQGERLNAKRVQIVRKGEKNSWLEVVLDEGKNRQIRKMLQELDIEVLRLIRVAIGPLPLGDLAKGQTRTLTAAEKSVMDDAMNSRRKRN